MKEPRVYLVHKKTKAVCYLTPSGLVFPRSLGQSVIQELTKDLGGKRIRVAEHFYFVIDRVRRGASRGVIELTVENVKALASGNYENLKIVGWVTPKLLYIQ